MKSTSIEPLKKHTNVFFRILPFEKMCWDEVKILTDRKTIYTKCPRESVLNQLEKDAQSTFWCFQFDHIFLNEPQQEIYNITCGDMVENLCRGISGIVLAFGQTGCGKSTTIGGLNYTYDDRGILPRLITDLFKMKKSIVANREMKVTIQISYVEISRTHVVDLLKPPPHNHNENLKDLSKIKIEHELDAFQYLFLGEARREVSKKSPYVSHSSCSVFTLHVNTKSLNLCSNEIIRSKLQVIDLAGADTIGNMSCLFKDPSDVGTGNLAKSQLEQFLLIFKTNIHNYIKVKQRLNPLIQYLSDSLTGEGFCKIIGHIRITPQDSLVTNSMLRFGQLMTSIKPTKHQIAIKESRFQKILNLQQQLLKMKTEYTFNAILNNHHDILKQGLNKDRYDHIHRTVSEYMEGRTNEVPLITVTDVPTALCIFKNICKHYKEDNQTLNSKLEDELQRRRSLEDKLQVKSNKSNTTSRSSMSLSTTKSENKQRSQINKAKNSQDAALFATRNDRKSSTSITKKRVSTGGSLAMESKGKNSKANDLLLPELAPEFRDAWNSFMTEKRDQYNQMLTVFEENQAQAKKVYANYVAKVNLLHEAAVEVDKRKQDLILAELTTQYQHSCKATTRSLKKAPRRISRTSLTSLIKKNEDNSKHLAITCAELLGTAEATLVVLKEDVLKLQAELREHLEVCKINKQQVRDMFDAYCEEKFRMPVIPMLENEEIDSAMDMQEIFHIGNESPEQITEKLSEDHLQDKFKKFRRLMEWERARIERLKVKHQNWVS